MKNPPDSQSALPETENRRLGLPYTAEQRGMGKAAQHTPGPWEARGESVWREFSTDLVATMQVTSEGYANARLIAAAPELLKALLALVRHVDGSVLGSLSPKEIRDSYRELDRASDAARAAIAKASATKKDLTKNI